MRSSCPPAPSVAAALTVETQELAAGTKLFRFHGGTYPADSFNPNRGKRMDVPEDGSRFNPFPGATAANVPTLYAATTFRSAALESVFHDVPHIPSPVFPRAKLAGWQYSHLRVRRPLRYLLLNNPHLRQLAVPGRRESLREDEIVHSSSNLYPATRSWARYLHSSLGTLDALGWRPRLGGEGIAFVFFGDRCGDAFDVAGPAKDLLADGLWIGRTARAASIKLI